MSSGSGSGSGNNHGHGREFVRWTDEEQLILIQLIKDQFELKLRDPSREIAWAALWRRISSQLEDQGFTRSHFACESHYRRIIAVPKASQETVPGSKWSVTENEILLEMCEDQLAREKQDPAAVVPWSTVWKAISSRLGDVGYRRSPQACADCWRRVKKLKKRAVPQVSTTEGAQDEEDQDEEIRPPALPHILPSSATSVLTPTQDEHRPRQHESADHAPLYGVITASGEEPSSRSEMPQTPNQSESPPRAKSKTRASQFITEQPVIPQAEAVKSGTCPDIFRRMLLACEIDKGQHQLSSNTSPGSNFNESLDAPTPTGSLKRKPSTLDCRESNLSSCEDNIGVQAQDDHPSKRIRLEPEYARHCTGEARTHISSSSARMLPIQSDHPEEGEFGQSIGSTTDASRNFSRADSSESRETAATSTSSYGTVVSSSSAADKPGGSALPIPDQALGSKEITSGKELDLQQSMMNESPPLQIPVSGLSGHPVNSAPRPRRLSNMPIPTVMIADPSGKPPPLSQSVAAAAAPSPQRKPLASGPSLASESVPGSEKEVFSRKASMYQAQIDNLNRDVTTRLQNISHIDQRVEAVTKKQRDLNYEKDQLIRQTIMEIEARYTDRLQTLQAEQASISQSKDVELEAMERSSNELKKRKKSLGHIQALIDDLDEPE
ncbi:hypothetical protein LZ554_007663 [Drepanopeziza brunnea f. sp. 'monogermtubi']|nr:hypothetical protein LZ554_007663 [Drepanopeziza brunnea f. sp. 'monogermtubi']